MTGRAAPTRGSTPCWKLPRRGESADSASGRAPLLELAPPAAIIGALGRDRRFSLEGSDNGKQSAGRSDPGVASREPEVSAAEGVREQRAHQQAFDLRPGAKELRAVLGTARP